MRVKTLQFLYRCAALVAGLAAFLLVDAAIIGTMPWPVAALLLPGALYAVYRLFTAAERLERKQRHAGRHPHGAQARPRRAHSLQPAVVHTAMPTPAPSSAPRRAA